MVQSRALLRPVSLNLLPHTNGRPAGYAQLIATVAIILIAACAQAASIAWPFDDYFPKGNPLWWMQWLALSTFAWTLQRSTCRRQAAALGWWFATVWLSATFWWLYVAMHTYAGLHGLLAAVAVVALAGALSVYYAVVCGLYWRLSRTAPLVSSLAFAALWTLAEMARGIWLTGFGWGAIGYAHIDGPLAWYIPWVGAYGVAALAAWSAMSLALLGRGRWRHAVAVAAVWGAPLVLPSHVNDWSTPAGSLSVTLLQGNIPQDEKFEAGSGVPLALQWYEAQLQANRSELVVAPETAVPVLPQQLPTGYWEALQSRFFHSKQAALIGIPLGSYAEGYTNSVLGLRGGLADTWRYDKHHLVPFGEFIPPLFKWFTALMNIPLGDFNRGGLGQPSFAVAGQRVAPNICYEDLFGEELATRFWDSASAPTLFANVSNIGWFGDTVAIDQHLHISRMRALEFQRPFVRATNTGATVILDHHAHVTASLPRHTRGVLEGRVEGRTGMTPFAWWASRVGLWPLWLWGLLVWVWAARQARQPRQDAGPP
ncbi:MAG: apolipoprotein N-acyltransferase [Rhodoferax sp.]|nr:apolipoprotein N-acyltransferase [Rhodoferax sp.]MDP3651832.1 apolipoprotein N-acyltransferase [Rhodoferax sp.]